MVTGVTLLDGAPELIGLVAVAGGGRIRYHWTRRRLFPGEEK
jgi:hypothetical protein